MKLPCTAIVLMHRETPTLWQCLSSLGWAEKIIVVDNSPQNNTERLFQAGVTDVFRLDAQITDFATIRNEAMAKVQTPWCFFLDSDEVATVPTKVESQQLVVLLADPVTAGLHVQRSDIFLGKTLSYGEAGNQELVRFMRPVQASWSGKAHETPLIRGIVKNSGLVILHYSHESIHSFIEDVSRYAKIVADERSAGAELNLLQLILYPPLKLCYDLVVLGAVLDGWRGVIYSYCMALHSLLVRIYRYEKNALVAAKPV